jgi:hypothetical protein
VTVYPYYIITTESQNQESGRDFIIEQCGAKSVAEFQRLTMEEQTRIVLDTKAEGASIRQVMSHTGWSYRRVREAGIV